MKLLCLPLILAGLVTAQTSKPVEQAAGTINLKRWNHDQGFAYYECLAIETANKSAIAFEVTIAVDGTTKYVDVWKIPEASFGTCRMVPRGSNVKLSIRELVGSFSSEF